MWRSGSVSWGHNYSFCKFGKKFQIKHWIKKNVSFQNFWNQFFQNFLDQNQNLSLYQFLCTLDLSFYSIWTSTSLYRQFYTHFMTNNNAKTFRTTQSWVWMSECRKRQKKEDGGNFWQYFNAHPLYILSKIISDLADNKSEILKF